MVSDRWWHPIRDRVSVLLTTPQPTAASPMRFADIAAKACKGKPTTISPIAFEAVQKSMPSSRWSVRSTAYRPKRAAARPAGA
jgi:hypothetical protein